MDRSTSGHGLLRRLTIGMRTFSALGLMVALIVSLGVYYSAGLKRDQEQPKLAH
jgi:hypothetical protein